jgi:hypothetical protein
MTIVRTVQPNQPYTEIQFFVMCLGMQSNKEYTPSDQK